MLVQLTNYGVSVLQSTKKPINIKKYVLGSSVNYTPSLAAEGITGEKVYENTPTTPIAVNANVVKYICAMGYEVGNFSFGEVAFYDDTGACVAVGVADELIDKKKYVDKKTGNSIVLDLYLSMVDGNYDMWIDDLRSDNEFNLPVCGSPDALPPVDQSSSNFYIITNAGRGQSSTLCYAGMNGIWDFDCYQYKNSHEFVITKCTAGTVYINASKLTDEDKNLLQPDYTGQLILQFIDGPNTSICRNIASFRVMNGEGILSLYTPMATIADIGNTIRVYSRQLFSISDVNLPIANKQSLGAVIIGDGISVTPTGVISADFPVTSVNGQKGDVELHARDIEDLADVALSNDYNDLDNRPSEYLLPIASDSTLGGVKISSTSNIEISDSGYIDLNFTPVKTVNSQRPDPGTGNVKIKFEDNISGLIFPKRVYARSELNNYASSGLFFALAADCNTMVHRPDFNFVSDAVLEVLPIGEGYENGPCVQRICTDGAVFVRQRRSNSSWTEWSRFLTTQSAPPATNTTPGLITIGKGLYKSGETTLNADMLSVFGKKGNVDLNDDEWKVELGGLFNTYDGLPQLTDDSTTPSEANREEHQQQFGRVHWRQMTYGGLYFAGDWDSSTNALARDPKQKLLANGRITHVKPESEQKSIDKRVDSDYLTWMASGWVVRVSVGSRNTLNLDGITRFNTGDLLISINGFWRTLYENKNVLASPKKYGFVYLDQATKGTYGRAIDCTNGSLAITDTPRANSSNGNIDALHIRIASVDGGEF